MQETSGVPWTGSGSGQGSGLLGTLIGLPGLALTSLLGILGLRKRKSGS
jgi:hypothetical protein